MRGGLQLFLLPGTLAFVMRVPWVEKSEGEVENRIVYFVKVPVAVQLKEG
jgi:hypothetical protein